MRHDSTGSIKSRTSLDGLPGEATELVAQLDEALLALLAGLPHNLANGANLVSGGTWASGDQTARAEDDRAGTGDEVARGDHLGEKLRGEKEVAQSGPDLRE